VRIERRTLPGETGAQALAEVQALCDVLSATRGGFCAELSLVCAQPPLDLSADAPLIGAVSRACASRALEPRIAGLSCWTDAALFAEAGIPALCFGPGDIARAHSATEWVELEQIAHATDVLEAVCEGWGR
jgi:acetylornithine deacetylase